MSQWTPKEQEERAAGRRLRWFLTGMLLLTLALGLLRTVHQDDGERMVAGKDSSHGGGGAGKTPSVSHSTHRRSRPVAPTLSAQEIVTAKLAQFARMRRGFMHELARRHQVDVPPEVERFFDAVESGKWEAIDAAFKAINGGDSSASHNSKRSPGVDKLWPAIIDAYGVAEQTHLWSPQQLLDYGNAVLESLQPGMVYVGGTDNGRWIPELLNDTSDGERHVVVTQNGLADGTYLDYLRLQYDDRLQNLSEEDAQRAFSQYLDDAEKRLQHDQDYPNEPKQLQPGEDVKMVDGKAEVSGQVAVMGINELLLQTLMQKNPGVSFAIQESFPLKGTYADALPMGPLMQLQARTDDNPFTPELAAQSLGYWQNMTQELLSDPGSTSSDEALKAYSHDTTAAARLLAAHDFSNEAESAYRLGMQLYPANPEPVTGLASLLTTAGRQEEANRLLDDFAQKYPDEQTQLGKFTAAAKLLWKPKSGGR